MRVGSDKQTVKVEASGELLKTQDASVGAVVDQRSVDSLPLNGRMLIDLVLTVPGAHISHGAATGDMNPLYWRPGQRSAVSIGGSRPNANYFLLDGATNTDPTFSAQNLSASPDAVQEFQVQTGSYSAEMGGAGGGQINIVTRSGTAHFHGTAYEFLRNGAMDAHSFNDMGMSNFLVQNNFGASIGGPIWRTGKTFFFVNYEGLRNVETHGHGRYGANAGGSCPETSARAAWISTIRTRRTRIPTSIPLCRSARRIRNTSASSSSTTA